MRSVAVTPRCPLAMFFDAAYPRRIGGRICHDFADPLDLLFNDPWTQNAIRLQLEYHLTSLRGTCVICRLSALSEPADRGQIIKIVGRESRRHSTADRLAAYGNFSLWWRLPCRYPHEVKSRLAPHSLACGRFLTAPNQGRKRHES
jgi:hypothetical protein